MYICKVEFKIINVMAIDMNKDWNTYSSKANVKISEILNRFLNKEISLLQAFKDIINLEKEFDDCEISTPTQDEMYETINEHIGLDIDIINVTFWKARQAC